ncbi:MAG: thiamine pyrophosphate-binding protein [Candidatus Yanofskybacteria bacterium]|nr:thiamine pyrophosphate-binding protein [Candidatus Yanofskybacteria bacterium]
MKLSDYVIHFLADLGLKHVFVLTGGYAVNLIDSFHKEPRLKHICVNHEQVGAMAAEAYSRFAGFGAMISTNAPGALNLLNGIDGAWNDSIPCIFICGQVVRERWNRSKDVTSHGREIVDMVTIAGSVTKYAQYVEDPENIKYYMETAVSIANEGRPGPVLLEIPLDVQKANVEPEKLVGFNPDPDAHLRLQKVGPQNQDKISTKITEALAMIKEAKRPVVLLGGGLRLSGTIEQARIFIESLGIPTVATWAAFDNMPHNHPLYLGNIGSYGNRRANFTVQNADLVIALGARLNVRQTGGSPNTFARDAKKIMVDIDEFELARARVKVDLPIKCDLRDFFDLLFGQNKYLPKLNIDCWRNQTTTYKILYTEVLPEYYKQKNSVNVYVFLKTLSNMIDASVPAVTDCGGNLIWTMQAFEVKDGQRVFSNMGLSSMGYSLAASIGVCLANDKKPTVCIIGDGGFQVHIQELETIKRLGLPIKVFVLNNHSYGIIKQTIESWFGIASTEELEKRCLAVSSRDGYSCPDFLKVARAYGIANLRIGSHAEMESGIREALDYNGPIVCDVVLDEHQKITPRLEFGNPLEDQHPLLPREELKKVMLIDVLKNNEEEWMQGI